MKKLVLILAVAVTFGMTANAWAIIPTQYGTGHDVFDAINRVIFAATGTSNYYSSNVAANSIQVMSGDSYWSDLSSVPGQGPYIAVGVSAGYSNDLSVYNAGNPALKSQVFTGHTGTQWFGSGATATSPFTEFAYSDLAGDPDFGWEMTSTPNGGTPVTWNSDPLKNNLLDGLDHMLTYDLSGIIGGKTVWVDPDGAGENEAYQYTFGDNVYMVFWEDQMNLGDKDFNDMVYLIDNVMPNVIPEPATMAMLATGLLGLFGLRRKRS